MQPIQKFSDFQNKKAEVNQAIKEADLQKEYGEVFVSLLKKYGVSSPAELDDDKKKDFFNEIGDLYKKGEGQTAKGEELVDKEGGDAPVKEEGSKGEEWKDDEEEIDAIASNEEVEDEDKKEKEDHYEGAAKDDADHIEKLEKDEEDDEKEVEKEIAEDEAKDIEKEKVEAGKPEPAEGDVEKQPEDVEPAAAAEEDPEAGKAAELAPDEDTAKEIEKDKVEAGKPEKVVMDFDAFVKANFEPKD